MNTCKREITLNFTPSSSRLVSASLESAQKALPEWRSNLLQNHNVNRFYFGLPFFKDSKDSIENCWLKRTIITLPNPVPYLVSRIVIPPEKGIQVIEYSPIEYSCRLKTGLFRLFCQRDRSGQRIFALTKNGVSIIPNCIEAEYHAVEVEEVAEMCLISVDVCNTDGTICKFPLE